VTRWSIKVQDDVGRARLIVLDGQNTIGVMTIPWADYIMITRQFTQFLLNTSRDNIKGALHARLYQDAIRIFDGSPQLAEQKLLEFGWNPEMIDSYADELSRQFVQQILQYMPEHT
jgi:hypothetical protein